MSVVQRKNPTEAEGKKQCSKENKWRGMLGIQGNGVLKVGMELARPPVGEVL